MPDKTDALSVKVDFIQRDVEEIKEQQNRIPERLEFLRGEIKSDMQTSKQEWMEEIKKYVTNERFQPVQLIVYGMVGAILLVVLGAILALIITKKQTVS